MNPNPGRVLAASKMGAMRMAHASCGQKDPPREGDGLNNFQPQKWVPDAMRQILCGTGLSTVSRVSHVGTELPVTFLFRDLPS